MLSAPLWKMKPYPYWLGQINMEWKGLATRTVWPDTEIATI